MRSFAAVVALLITVTFANVALACGESLYRVGRDVLYREYTAPLPGNLLVVARTEAELMMAERLAAAGHDVHVVSGPAAIGEEIAGSDHTFDLVLAYFSQRTEIEVQTASRSISYLPVVLDPAEKARAEALYGRSVSDQASVKRFLRSIHAVLRGRA